MFDVDLIEKIVASLLGGKTSDAAELLQKEAALSHGRKKHLVGRRLENLAKKLPANSGSGFGAASLDTREAASFPGGQLVTEYMSDITPEEVVLNHEAKAAVSSLFREWEDFERLASHGLRPINKILLYGPPGTGKTRLANAIANQLGFPIILVRLDELISSYLGRTGKNIREIFDAASERNVVLFLDEIDTIAKRRADERELGELKRIVTVLLQNIDLFPQNSLIIGATNHEDMLDKALWRRFPLKIQLELPTTNSRSLLVDLFLGETTNKIDKELITRITDGMNGSEIFDLIQQSRKNYVISSNKDLQTKDVILAYFQMMNGKGLEKKVEKQMLYTIAQHLYDHNFSLRDIEAISGIPYTTLRDNIQ